MEVVLLGTGAADGWPNPFCACASCRTMLQRGEIRAQTAALVDDVLMLDCGPEIPRAALHARRTLAGVRHLLLTHAHPDHVGPLALLMRSWVSSEPLDVVGPPEALDLCRDWVAPDAPIRWTPVAPGDSVTVGNYRVRTLPAAHRVHRDGDSVLYEVVDVDGRKLLWATDTGPLPDDTVDMVRGARYDVVFLEETFGHLRGHAGDHLDLDTFPRALATLRAVGAIVDGTDIIAVHLGHNNPPNLPELLRPWGVRVVPDGTAVAVGDPGALCTRPHRTLVLGGARAGKTTHAQQLLADRDDVTYLATAAADDTDPDWTARITAHRATRPQTWTTIETDDIAAVLRDATGPVLVDCLGTWLARRADTHHAWDNQSEWDAVQSDINRLVAALRNTRAPVVLVSNEVGSGIVPATASGRRFRDTLGRLNAAVASECEAVNLLVAGRVLPLR